MREAFFPVIISDYRMPGMNGIEFLRRASEIAPDSIRIILTGYADTDVAVSAINEGHIYKFITKPWNDDQLSVHIRRGFEHHDLLMESKRLQATLIEKNKALEDINNNLERMVEERTQQLLHSAKLATLGQIAGQIGHEIKNSLTILKGRMQLLKKREHDADYVSKTLEIYEKEFDRLDVYANNLFSFGRPAPPDFQNIDLRTVLDNTVENLLTSGVLKYYTIVRRYRYEEAIIYGDPGQIDQVFTNVLINAHHAMDNNGELAIEMEKAGDGEYIEAIIRDTGRGIPQDALEKVFEPFYTTKPEGKGTGLGLSVVRQIMKSHRGYVRIESREGAGTTVTVGLPLVTQ